MRPREELWEGKGSKIWILCKASSSFMMEHLVGSQGMGNAFTCGKIPYLTSSPVLSLWNSLSGWKSMVVIVLWTYPTGTTKDQGLWCGWLALDLPIHLLNHWHSMINRLKGFAPIITSKLDSRVWLGGKSKKYTVKDGYAPLIKNPSSPLPQKSGGRFGTEMGFLRSISFVGKWCTRKSLWQKT